VDPNTLSQLGIGRGDSFFLITTVNPSHFQIPLQKLRVSLSTEMYCYDVLPPYRILDEWSVSYDDEFVYDVELPATCMSRRFKAAEFAEKHKLKLKPLSAYGKWVAHPYSMHFEKHDWNVYDEIIVQQSHAMSKNALREDIHANHKGPILEKAVAFVMGETKGEKLTPLEQFGSYVSVPLYQDETCKQWHYPDIRGLQGKKAMVFGSIQEMKTHLHLLIYVMVPFLQSIAFMPFQENETQTELDYDSTLFEGEIRKDTLTSTDKSNTLSKVRLAFVEHETLTLRQIIEMYPNIRTHTLREALFRAPELRVETEGDIAENDVWSRNLLYWGGIDDGNIGLASYTDSSTLKSDVIGGVLKFKDKLILNTRGQQNFLLTQGYEVIFSKVTKKHVTIEYCSPF